MRDRLYGKILRGTILCAAFISGFSIMTVELLGGRVLSPYFGSSVYVWGSLITVFMLSLSIGYLLGGKLSMRNPNPNSYALFFVIAAILVLPVIQFAQSIMEQIFLIIDDPRYGSLLAATCMYFLPICFLGMISPYSVRLLVEHEHHSGQVAGMLYFLSTLGSALGTLVTSFYFVLWFEVNQILWGVIVALVITAAGISLVYRLPAMTNARLQQTARELK
jgi:hypothetical protein